MNKLSRAEIVAKFKASKQTSTKRKPSTKPIRANKKKRINRDNINTKLNMSEVREGVNNALRSTKPDWKSQRRLHAILPYVWSAKRGYIYNEGRMVRWVERGEHPFNRDVNLGPAAHRSVFDYLTDKQLDEAIKLSNGK